MDEELETFDLYSSSDSIAPTRDNEGTNAVRFAMMASLLPVEAQDVAGSRPLVAPAAAARRTIDAV